jgi:diaminohydroxyphosphoribosylaminopyrimidine deaminase/5-amino-6-(5-phosphoribosylamino)uracil reductase
MRKAIQASRRGYPAPNPHVGCVIVSDGEIVGMGHSDHSGGPHAEVMALTNAGSRAAGADVYVTLEPCNHQGRTGPCSEALVAAGVGRVFVACMDPNPVAKGGAERLEAAGIPVETGILAADAADANVRFLRAYSLERPYVVLKAAASLDGRIALPSGESKWITGQGARRAGHKLRAEMGAVLVGSGTVLADDPSLTARIPGVVNQPLKIVLDPERRLHGTEQVFRGGDALHVVAEGRKGGLVFPLVDGAFPLDGLMAHLWKLGVTGLLVEGGPTTLTSFVKQRIADRIELFVAPKLLGAGPAWLCDFGLRELGAAIIPTGMKVSRAGNDLRISADLTFA